MIFQDTKQYTPFLPSTYINYIVQVSVHFIVNIHGNKTVVHKGPNFTVHRSALPTSKTVLKKKKSTLQNSSLKNKGEDLQKFKSQINHSTHKIAGVIIVFVSIYGDLECPVGLVGSALWYQRRRRALNHCIISG